MLPAGATEDAVHTATVDVAVQTLADVDDAAELVGACVLLADALGVDTRTEALKAMHKLVAAAPDGALPNRDQALGHCPGCETQLTVASWKVGLCCARGLNIQHTEWHETHKLEPLFRR